MNEHVVDPEAHADIRELITQLQDGLENAGTGNVSEHNVDAEAHADIRELITQLQNIIDNHATDTEAHADIRASIVHLESELGNIDMDAHNIDERAHQDIRILIEALQKNVDKAPSESVSEHNVDAEAHNDIRELIDGLNTRLNALADSDDATLDQLSEIVEYIKSNKSLIEAVTIFKVSVDDIVDDLTSTATDRPLSANQGRILSEKIDNLDFAEAFDIVDNLTTADPNAALSANQGKILNEKIDNLEITGGSVDIVDNLTTDDSNAALSAKQGKILNDKIDNLDFADAFDIVDNLESSDAESALSANQGRVLNEKVESIETKSVVSSYNEETQNISLEFSVPTQGIVEDTLESDNKYNALSANQGRVLKEAVNTATDIAKGKNKARVFNTIGAMDEWLSDEANKGVANVGDNLYIVDTDVPDWWISEVLEEPNEDGEYYEIAELETQKVDLSAINNKLPIPINVRLTEGDTAITVSHTTQLGSITVPANSLLTLSVIVNNRSHESNFKLGLTFDNTNPNAIRWGEMHTTASQYHSFCSTIILVNDTNNEVPVYAFARSTNEMAVAYVFVQGIAVPL